LHLPLGLLCRIWGLFLSCIQRGFRQRRLCHCQFAMHAVHAHGMSAVSTYDCTHLSSLAGVLPGSYSTCWWSRWHASRLSAHGPAKHQ
jgi:hypothetical protein